MIEQRDRDSHARRQSIHIIESRYDTSAAILMLMRKYLSTQQVLQMPGHNRNAFTIFERDVTRLCEYFTRQGLSQDPNQLAKEIWIAQGYHVRPGVHPRLLDGDNPGDLKFWKRNERAK